jgi:translocation and assembly module TamB
MAIPFNPLRWSTGARAGLASAIILATGAAVATGPGAAWLVDSLVDGVSVWRLGKIRVDDVTGPNLGALQAGEITFEDENGVWAEIRNVRLNWRPAAIFASRIEIQSGAIGDLHVLRQPILSEARPPNNRRIDVRIDALQLERIAIDEAVYGAAAELRGGLAMNWRARALERLELHLERQDSDADQADISLRQGTPFALNAHVRSAPGGVIARALGVGEHGLTLDAEGSADQTRGDISWSGAVGEENLAEGLLSWTATRWELRAQTYLDALPALEAINKRLGDQIAINGGGVRGGHFSAMARSPTLTLAIEGEAGEGLDLNGPARITAETADLSEIAPEAPFPLGPANFGGTLTRRDGRMELSGVLDAQRLELIGENVRLTGPIRAQLTPTRFELTSDLRAPPEQYGPFQAARLQTEMDLDRAEGRFRLRDARLSGPGVNLTARGWSHGRDGQYGGDWRLQRLQDFASDLRGQLSGHWRAQAEPETFLWTASVEGQGQNISGAPEIVPQALGRSPTLAGAFRFENRGVTVSHARLDGPKLRAGAMGRIVGGEADLRVEMSAQGPLTIGAAEFNGAIDGVGHITGRFTRPRLQVDAQLASFTAAGATVVHPNVSFTLAPDRSGHYRGQAEVQGTYAEQPVSATSDLVLIDGGFALPNLNAHLAALNAQGQARIDQQGFSADLALNGAIDNLAPSLSGGVNGHLTLAPALLQLNADMTNARMGELRLRAAHVEAQGPFNAIAANFTLRGGLRQAPLDFTGTALVNTEDGIDARIEGQGALAGNRIATREPMVLRLGENEFEASLNIQLGDGGLIANWRERGRALSGHAQVENAPIAPLAAIWGETATGAASGHANLESGGGLNGGGLSGSADLRFEQARIAGRQRGTLDAHLVATLTPSRLQAALDATSSDGLIANIAADAPVETSAAPIRIALQPERRGRATWSVRGSADALWAAARMQDQSLSGALEGEGELSFGAGSLTGDGGIELTDGAFEDKLTGVKLQNIDARIAFNQSGVVLERFTAADRRGGALSASGGSSDPQHGRIALQMRNLWLVDRPDARARANGDLSFEWQGLQSALTGDLNIVEGDVRIASNAEAGIPRMDVVEINRPEDEYFYEEAALRPGDATTTLNVHIRAPGRIFTRGRGVEAEWALDMRLTGTAAQPLFYGEARSVRGTLALSGTPFEIERGLITFDGLPENALIDLVAERQTADLTARISLTGTANDPDIRLSSTPALPEDEILPQVLFGRAVEDLSGFEAAQVAASLATLSGRSSLDLMDAARAVAGLDRFAVREDENGGFIVGGGVYLTRDVYVEVARSGLGEAQTQVEWTIRPRLVLITSFLPNGDRRASIRWRRETD